MVLIIALVCGGCTSSVEKQPGTEKSMNSYPMVVEDSLGRKVTISGEPERIVSLAPANTEILFALGLEEKVVGVTNYCDYPQEAAAKEKVGDFYGPSVEKTLALEPDVIFATGGIQKETVGQLEALGQTVIALDPKNIEEILEAIQLAGQITNRNEQARALTGNMKQRIEKTEKALMGLSPEERPKTFVLVWIEGSNIFSAGPVTFVSSIISMAGGLNVADDAKVEYPQYSVERLMETDPEVLISIDHETPLTSEVRKSLHLNELKAVKNGRVFTVQDADVLTLPGPRIVDGLELVSGFLHPELFPSEKTGKN